MEIIGQGAEAIIRRDEGAVIKERVPKAYRHPDIDQALRKSRTKREAKVLSKLPVPGPTLISCDNISTIRMSYLDGPKLVDCLEQNLPLAKELGKVLTKLHEKNIIHGDLTTSNMLHHNNKVHLIDFGLSFFSTRIEDRAVDIHLLRQALESKHHTVWKEAFALFLEGYTPHNRDEILDRFAQVEKRGRHKTK